MASARARASAAAAMCTPHSSWLTSLTFCPSPGAVPTCGALRAIASSSGCSRSTAGSAPPTMIRRSPSAARAAPPETGASTRSTCCCGEPLGPALDRGGADGGHHDDGRAGGERGGGRVVAEQHALDLVRGGDHDDEHVRRRRPPRGWRSPGARRRRPAPRRGRGRCRRRACRSRRGPRSRPSGSPWRPGRSIPTRRSRRCRSSGPSAEQVDHVGQGVLVADVAGEHDVGDADDLGQGLDGPEHRHQPGQQLAEDGGAADAQAAHGDVVGGDAALGDHPGRLGRHGAAHDLDDRGGHVPGDLQAGRGVAARAAGSGW